MKTTLYVHSVIDSWNTEARFSFSESDLSAIMPNSEYTLLGTMEIDVPFALPGHAEVIAQKIAVLRGEQGKLMAQVTLLDSKINDLLCLEHRNEEVPE